MNLEYVLESDLDPDEVFSRLSVLREPPLSYASNEVRSSSLGRVYVYLSQPEFQASLSAGMNSFGVIGKGSVLEVGSGSLVRINFHFGGAPSNLPQLLVLLGAALSVVAAVFSLLSYPALVVLSPIPLAIGYVGRRALLFDVRFVLQQLSDQLDDRPWIQHAAA